MNKTTYTLKFPDRPDIETAPNEYPKSVMAIDGVTYLELPQSGTEERERVLRYYRADGYDEMLSTLSKKRIVNA